MYIFGHISLNSSQNEKYFTENCKTRFYVEYIFFSEIVPFMT